MVQLARAQKYFIDAGLLFATYVGLRTYQPGDVFRLRHSNNASIKTWRPVDVVTTWVIFCGKEYEVCAEDETILDCGANIGIFSLYAAVQAPHSRIVSMEPVAETYEKLTEQISRSPFKDRITCVRQGIAGDVGTRRILLGTDSDTSSLYQALALTQDFEQIDVTTYADALDSYQIDRLSLLKLDCEGAEWEVFDKTPGEIWDRTNRVCLEYHLMDEHSPEQITLVLKSRGMRQTRWTTRPNMTGVMWFAR